MTKDESKIKDWRSTGRRKARRTLYKARISYECVKCGRTSIEPPKDAPKWFDDIWPEQRRVLDYQLQADHLTKDFTINDLEFLDWKCAPCHKEDDSKTGKGIAQQETELW